MFASLLLIALPVEGPRPLLTGLASLTETKGTFLGIGILLFPGILAFLMTSSEFALLQRTSVVTLSICGIFKEVVTISAAGIAFHDPLNPINVSGLLVTIGSIAAYNYIKISKMRNDAREVHHLPAADEDGAHEPMLAANGAVEGEGQARGQHARRSTSALVNGTIRPSLSIPQEALRDGHVVESPARASPVKRPEDLE
ncbi:MAG: Triose-phosphate Transporter [Pleopsidium flavum]|nr:MAG: Triose-phosphate Transporter [Pleopsidium flavum]